MNRGLQGTHLASTGSGGEFEAFVPHGLPPKPAIQIDDEITALLGRANRAIGRLDGLVTYFPDRYLFLYFYVRKEALLSSQIEGTQSSLSELLLFEDEFGSPREPREDVVEVSRYVEAMNLGLARLKEGFPLSARLLRELHGVLLRAGRGSHSDPGNFRRSQNWIGGSRPGNAIFVAPPPGEVADLISNLEFFLHDKHGQTPLLIKAAIAHVQFETIHPFLDGNGRLGRLMISLLLVAEEALAEPLLYLSLYLKKNRTRYYDLLQKVRLEGVWEEWLRFFLEGVIETAEQATSTAARVRDLFTEDRKRIEDLGRTAGSVLRVHNLLERKPLISIASADQRLTLTTPTIGSAMDRLVNLGIVEEVTGKKRDRLFAYRDYLAILSEGTEPLPV